MTVIPTSDIDFSDVLISELLVVLESDSAMRAFLVAIAERWQSLDELMEQLRDDRLLASAEGAQLDQLGAIFGQGRLGYSDDVYRALIATRLIVNRADGRIEALLNIVEGFYGITDVVALYRGYLAEFVLEIATDGDSDPVREALFSDFILQAAPAGVETKVVFSAAGDNTFRLDTGNGLDVATLAAEI